MAKRKFKNSQGRYKKAVEVLKGIKALQGDHKIISIEVRDNGMKDDDNPAFYGALHEAGAGYDSTTGRYYKFLEPALRNFKEEILKGYGDVLKNSLSKQQEKKRTQKELLDNAEKYAKAGVDRVQEYILYEAPQYPERKRKNPSLIETGELFDSIIYTIINKNGEILRGGQ